uniref:sn-1-specific diacylglycerol lipase n=1 Tax=Attheya septentrionalis TaxID=420275 RepID=A0A7S2UFL9_9STRA|mmetsp:Transcript_20661/g.37366  ORF Transcript_20661/g.37366 Transcript_20661/m.37366 type:complete len:566 (+) Transcript_20661:155-1852(+)
MPHPILLGPPALAALKSLYAASPSVSTVSSTSLVAILTHLTWRKLPPWIQDDPWFRQSTRSIRKGKKGDDDDDILEEMASLSCVLSKLQALAASGSEKLVFPLTGRALHASVLAAIQLAAQFRVQYPHIRDAMCLQIQQHAMANSNPNTRINNDESEESKPNRREDAGMPPAAELLEALDFAIWAYEDSLSTTSDTLRSDLEGKDYFLLAHRRTSKPGHVGYYVAFHPEKKTVLIGLKGTSTLEELLTDCCGRSVEYELRQEERVELTSAIDKVTVGNDESIEVEVGVLGISIEDSRMHVRCHEGILLSARRLADELQPLIQYLSELCGYKILICGHSLGAGAGALLGMIFRARMPWLLEGDCLLQVYAFACPPVLDQATALACCSFTTSIVNNSDIVPRSGLANVAVAMEFLKTIHVRLTELGLSLNGPRNATRFIQKLSQGTEGECILTLEEARVAMTQALETVEVSDPDHLYVPGRVIMMYETWDTPETDQKYWNESTKMKESPVKQPRNGNVESFVTDGMTEILRLFEVDEFRMFTDHLTSSYSSSIERLSKSEERKDSDV